MVSEAARAGMALVLVFCLGVGAPAGAGLLDDLKQAASDTVDEAVDEVKGVAGDNVDEPDKADKAEESTAGAPSTGNSAETAMSSDTASSDLPTSALRIARGIVAAEPDVFTGRPQEQLDERKLKKFVLLFYPEDREEVQNKFKWRKNRASYLQRLQTEGEGAPTTFPVAPWLDNAVTADTLQANELRFYLGGYDFENEIWPITVTQFRLPWLPGNTAFVSYEITNADLRGSDYAIPMSPAVAEKFDQMVKETGRRVFGRYSFTIGDVMFNPKDHPRYAQYERDLGKLPDERRNRFLAAKLPPVAQVEIHDGQIELYLAKNSGGSAEREDYVFLGTLDTVSGEIERAEDF